MLGASLIFEVKNLPKATFFFKMECFVTNIFFLKNIHKKKIISYFKRKVQPQ